MFRILYLSTANQQFSSQELTDLLQKARARNEAVHVTGMLIHSDGDFLQVLEGEPENVIGVYDRISVDPRHRDISVLQRGLGHGDRLFPTWTMGFKRVPDQTLIDEAIGVMAGSKCDIWMLCRRWISCWRAAEVKRSNRHWRLTDLKAFYLRARRRMAVAGAA